MTMLSPRRLKDNPLLKRAAIRELRVPTLHDWRIRFEKAGDGIFDSLATVPAARRASLQSYVFRESAVFDAVGYPVDPRNGASVQSTGYKGNICA
jgi:hypothetical protein